MQKNFIEIPTDVDELNLSLRGWTVHDFRARLLVSDDSPESWELAQLTVSIRAQFAIEDCVEPFHEINLDSITPPLVVSVSEPTLTSCTTLVDTWEDIRVAQRGISKTIRPDFLGVGNGWRHPDNLIIKLTAYDATDLRGCDFSLLRPVECPIEIVDETSARNPYSLTDIAGQLLARLDPDEDDLWLRLDGFVSVDQRAARNPKYEYDYDSIYPPEIKFEILDDTGFPMDTSMVSPLYSVRTDQVPRRSGRWVSQIDLDTHVKPGRMLMRIVDNEDDRFWNDGSEDSDYE